MQIKNTILLLILSFQGFAQADSIQTRTLFGSLKSNSKYKIQYFGMYSAPEISYSSLAGDFTPIATMSGMVVFNKKVAIGLSGANTTMRNYAPSSLSSKNNYTFNAYMGGMKLEFTPKPNDIVHVSFPLFIGGVGVKIDTLDSRFSQRSYPRKGNNRRRSGYSTNGRQNMDAPFVIFQPGINLELSLLKFVKLYGGVNYRISGGKSNLVGNNPIYIPKSSQVSGLGIVFGGKFGFFDVDFHKKNTHIKRKNHLFKKHNLETKGN